MVQTARSRRGLFRAQKANLLIATDVAARAVWMTPPRRQLRRAGFS
jgi:hypothetical protein